VQVELGVEITSFTQDASSVTAQLLKTTQDGQKTKETLIVDYVVGMDGARGSCVADVMFYYEEKIFILIDRLLAGVTRKLLEIPFAGESLAQTVLVADAAIEGLDRDVSVGNNTFSLEFRS
jgi:hypothetical protein